MQNVMISLLWVLLSLSTIATAQQLDISTSKGYPSELEWVFHTDTDRVKYIDRGTIHYTLVYTRAGSSVSEMFRSYTHISKKAKDRFTVFNQKQRQWQSTYNSIAIHRYDRITQSLPNDDFSRQLSKDFLMWQNPEVAAIIYYRGNEKKYVWVEQPYQNEVESFIRSIPNVAK